MGINTSGHKKHTKSGGVLGRFCKKRKNRMGRQPSNTRIGEERIRDVRVRGGNIKKRALRLNQGSFQFVSSSYIAPTKIEEVVYHPSSNELMRTNTLTKSSVVKIESTPFVEEIKKCQLESIDPTLIAMADKGFLLGIITSRPGQEGVAKGYILQGRELEFYQSKLKKGKALL